MHQIRKQLSWIIPLLIIFMASWKVFNYFGQVWEIGTFSTAFVPFITQLVAQAAGSETEVIGSNLVILGYIGGTLTFYLFAYQLTRRHLIGSITALLTLLPLGIVVNRASEGLILETALIYWDWRLCLWLPNFIFSLFVPEVKNTYCMWLCGRFV